MIVISWTIGNVIVDSQVRTGGALELNYNNRVIKRVVSDNLNISSDLRHFYYYRFKLLAGAARQPIFSFFCPDVFMHLYGFVLNLSSTST